MVVCESRVRALAVFQNSRIIDDLCDVFWKKGIVFTKIKLESLDSNADLSDSKVLFGTTGLLYMMATCNLYKIKLYLKRALRTRDLGKWI